MFVSVVVPCRNEGKFIAVCLGSIIANDYPKDELEILVIDGMSEDGTRQIVGGYLQQYRFIRLLDNPKEITPAALNIGIKEAQGQIIMRMDAHATYAPDYISKCVRALEDYQTDSVGGIWKIIPRTQSFVGKAITQLLSHKFGVGNADYRLAEVKEPKLVDTVPFFCCRKEVFRKVGLFNEQLARGQDMEFYRRLRNAGGKILLVPDIVSHYYARSDLRSFWKHNWRNGVWAILPFLYSPVMPVSWRHLVPLIFVVSLIGSAALGFVMPPFLWVCLVIAGAYSCATLAASSHIAWRERDLRYFAVMPLMFGMLHIGYGLGSFWGVLKLLGAPRFWRRFLGLEEHYGTATR